MDFEVRKTQHGTADQVDLVFRHNPNQSSVQVLTWNELERLADVIEHAMMLRFKENDETRRCDTHPAFEASNCPGCGTQAKI